MSSEDTYKQATLKSTAGRIDVAWIPSSKAKVGKLLVLGDNPTVWQVLEVYDTVRTGKDLLAGRENLKRFKWVLGDS